MKEDYRERSEGVRGCEVREGQWPQSYCHNQFHHCPCLLLDSHHIAGARQREGQTERGGGGGGGEMFESTIATYRKLLSHTKVVSVL